MTFTPVETTVGAVLIHLATTNYYLQRGATIGFSSTVFKCFTQLAPDSVRIVVGMFSSSLLVRLVLPQFIPPPPTSSSNLPLHLIGAGLLVGLGTKWGCGCTSGHMIAGLSRLRLRSLVATGVFASVAMGVVYLTGLGEVYATSVPNYAVEWNTEVLKNRAVQTILGLGFLQVYVFLPYLARKGSATLREYLTCCNGIISGFLFGLGLHIAGMLSAAKTIGFLALPTPQFFDPSLGLIMVFAVIPNIFVWRGIKKPLLADKFSVATSTDIPLKLIIGAALFGLGWGLMGICPGPGLLNMIHYPTKLVWWLGSFVVGHYVAGLA